MNWLSHFRRLASFSRRLSEHQLRHLEDWEMELSEQTLFGDGSLEAPGLYFLGYYSRSGLDLVFKKYGFYEDLRELGYRDLKMVMKTDDPFSHRLALYNEREDPEHLLTDLVARRKTITLNTPIDCEISGRQFEVLFIEWLTLQNYKGKFSGERPRLPGQKYPGLGLGWVVLEFLLMASRRLGFPAILNIPEYFHNAQIYASHFHFADPVMEGRRQAIERDLLSVHPLGDVAWAIDQHCVLENGNPFQWSISGQFLPLSAPVKAYFNDPRYRRMVAEAREGHRYMLDPDAWARFQAARPADTVYIR
ncbi:MAG: hypothetical protein KDI06_09925 [Calditrichaeota bacterium]|nr:hypothetical protein [Calditrichota bacterium]